jgi:hypothetical protein
VAEVARESEQKHSRMPSLSIELVAAHLEVAMALKFIKPENWISPSSPHCMVDLP